MVEVVDPQDARDGAGHQRSQRVRDGLEQADPRTRAAGGCGSAGRSQRCRQVDKTADLGQRGRIEGGQSLWTASRREPRTQEVGDRPVGDHSLVRVAATRQDDPTACADPVGHRLAEPRLADPGLALDDHDASIRMGGTGRGEHGGEFAVTAGEREPRHRLRQGDAGRTRFDLGAILADRLVQVGRLAQRRDAQLAIEQGDQRAVLADRPRRDRPTARGAR